MHAWIAGWVLGLALPAGFPALPGLLALAGLGLAGLVLTVLRSPTCWLLGGLLLGLVWSCGYGQRLLVNRLTGACEAAVIGTVASLPRRSLIREGVPRQRFEFRPERLEGDFCGTPRRLLLSYYGAAEVRPGQRWRFPVVLLPPWGLVNRGSFNMQSWYAQSGIDAVGRVRGEGVLLEEGGGGWYSRLQRLRWRISRELSSLALEPVPIAVLQALTVADRSGIDAPLWQRLQQFGINHLLVISGLHIGLVAGLALLLGAALGRCWLLVRPDSACLRWLPGLGALVVAGIYTGLAGFTLATVRAYLMLCCLLLCLLRSRPSSAWTALLLAAFCILLQNPLAILSSGTWLSFSAVAALLWLGQWRPRLNRGYQLLLAHLFMALVMVPLGAWWFGGFSLLSAPANLVLVPLVGWLLVPLALSGAGLFLLVGTGHQSLWQLAGQGIDRVLQALDLAAMASPVAPFQPLVAGLLPVLCAALAVALVVIPVGAWRWCVAVLLCLPLALPPRNEDPQLLMNLAVLDVGQGTAVVLRSAGHTLVYDTGGGDPAGLNLAASVLLPYLRQAGVKTINTLVISHPDTDHSAGMQTVLDTLPVARLFVTPGQDSPAGALPGRTLPCLAGTAWRWPSGVSFQFLAPVREPGLSSNDSSCVLRVEGGGWSALLPGDISAERERQLLRYWQGAVASKLLLAAHHGSNSSSGTAWLKHIDPGETVFTRGFGNRFGHPHPAVVQRVRDLAIDTGDTALEGAVEYRVYRDGRVQREALREQRRRYWM